MKPIFRLLSVACCAGLAVAAIGFSNIAAHAQTVITAFNFNNTGSLGTLLASTSGQTTSIVTNFAPSDLSTTAGTFFNELPGDGAGTALLFSNLAENGNYFEVPVSTAGYYGVILSFADSNNPTGFGQVSTENQVYYSLTGANGTFIHEGGFGSSLGSLSDFAIDTVNYGGHPSVFDNDPNLVFKIVLEGATSASGSYALDNVVVSGTVAPEPTTLTLTLIACLPVMGIASRRHGMNRES